LNVDSLEPAPEKKQRTREISTKRVTRTPSEDPKAKAREAAEKAAREEQQRLVREAAERRSQLAATVGRMADNLGNSLSSGTSIELRGPGGGGVPYANWLQAVKTRYVMALIEPEGITEENIVAVASVTIARDGTVTYHRINKPSGNAAFDRAVRATLERVKWAAPLPDDAKEDERTVNINFKPRLRELRG
jgi:TolA protein